MFYQAEGEVSILWVGRVFCEWQPRGASANALVRYPTAILGVGPFDWGIFRSER